MWQPRPTKIETMMDVARIVARRSTCQRMSVGAVLADRNMEQLWYGYNGGPRGGINQCRRPEEGNCGCLHAETNAIIKAPGNIAKMAFLTHSPCPMCATMLVNAHVFAVYYDTRYRDDEGLAILADAGVKLQGRTGDMDEQMERVWPVPKHIAPHG